MTTINNSVKAKIEIEGLKTYIKTVPATIATLSTVGTAIYGQNSGATAVLQRDANIGDTHIYIVDVVGDFDYSEPLIDSAQFGTSSGSTSYVEEYYINSQLGSGLFSSVEMGSNFDIIPAGSIAVGAISGARIKILEELEAFYLGNFDFEYLTNIEMDSMPGEVFNVESSVISFDVIGPADTPTQLWAIESTGDLGVSIDDSIRRIDIDEGGNFATGYTFGFTLTNFTLVKSLLDDGVFLQNLPVRYYIDFDDGNGHTQLWTGILDTFPTAGVTTAVFKCIDSMKARNTNFGSSTVPVALNRNYNCKLVLPENGESENIIKYESIQTGNEIDYYYCAGANKDFSGDGSAGSFPDSIADIEPDAQTLLFLVKDGTGWASAFSAGGALSIKVVAGSQAGSTYNVTSVTDRGYYTGGGYTYYLIGIDSSTDSIIGELQSDFNNSISLMSLVNYENTYNLSQNEVLDVHSFNGINKETVKSTTDGKSSYLSTPENYTTDKKQVFVTGINDDGEITAQENIDINTSSWSITDEGYIDHNPGVLSQLTIQLRIPLIDLYRISNKSDTVYLSLDAITYSTTYDVNGYVDASQQSSIVAYGNFKTDIVPLISNRVYFLQEVINTGATKIGSDIKVQYIIPLRSIEFDNFGNSDVYSNAYCEIITTIAVRDSAISGQPIITDVDFDGFKYTLPVDIKADVMSVGCNGENVGTGNEFESYPDTIKYIESTYGGILASERNEQSFIDAQDTYKFFPSYTDRNPAHQIIDQTDVNSVLKDMLYYSHLGYFIDREGKRTLSNWLVKSTVFSDTTPESIYSTGSALSIGDIKRPRIKKIASDYQIDYDFNESTGEYERSIRIKNTNEASFDFIRDTEGVSAQYYQVAEEAWTLLSAGEKRVKRQSQTVTQSKWIKDLFTFRFLGGESEAINFVRNQAGHINREHEKITITLPLNATDAVKELLSFDSINGDKYTEFENRYGWITDIRISWNLKQIMFTYMLDISLKDPFLVQIGIIQDNTLVDDIIVDDETETNIIEDGAGK